MNKTKYIYRLGVDVAVIILCYFIARTIFPYGDSFSTKRGLLFFAYVISFWYFAAQITFLYNEFLSRSLSKEIITVIKTIVVQNIFIIIALFFFSRNPLEAKFVVAAFAGLQLITLPIVKYISRWYYSYVFQKGKRVTSILVVGAGELGLNFTNIIQKNYQLGYKIAGFLDDVEKKALNGKYLGKIDQLEEVLQNNHVEDVIIALPNTALEKIKFAVRVSEEHAKRVRIIPDYARLSNSFSISTFGTLPILSLRAIPLDNAEFRFFKRVFDISFTIVLFITIFSWLFPILALLIKLTSKGPVFFIQERWGINNKKIYCYKFRSMIAESKDVDDDGVYLQATKNDTRITSIGKILRKTNLDELPQFLNVLLGDMSVVGPRPHPTPLNLHSRSNVNNYMIRHLVRPGITGWAQIHGFRGETKDVALMQKRIDFDIWYIENWSFWLDIQIIIQTVINMIKGDKNAY